MWETWGGVEASMSSQVGLVGVFVSRVTGHVMVVVSIGTTLSSTVAAIVIRGVHVQSGADSSFCHLGHPCPKWCR